MFSLIRRTVHSTARSSCLARLRAAFLCCALQVASVWAAGGSTLPSEARQGDLIFREGTELVSEAVLAVDARGFSHVGMLVGSPAHWQVVHSTPSEVPGRPDGVVLDDLAFFTDPVRARRAQVYHVPDATQQQRQAAVDSALAALGTPFSFASAHSVYCTTLVWQAWRDAGLDLDVAFTPLALPLIAGDYLLPGVLSQSKHLQVLSGESFTAIE